MLRIGIFLGVSSSSGGMFNYSQTILDSLKRFDSAKYKIVIGYENDIWENYFDESFETKKLEFRGISNFIVRFCNLLQLRGNFKFFSLINPQISTMKKLNCDLWIFPSQDLLTFHMDGTVIGTIHDLMHRYESQFPEVNSKYRYFLRENRYKNIVNRSSLILVDSELGKDQVVESYSANSSKIVPLPYVTPSYIKNSKERKDFNDHYNLPKDFLFYPAQFWEHKNHKRLIRAIKIINEDFQDLKLVLTGLEINLYKELSELVDSLKLNKKIIFKGYVPENDLSGFYKRAKALIFPTFFGPTNIPPLEAISSNCIPIVSDIYAMKEQLGKSALYFNPLEIDEIVEAIKLVLSNDSSLEEVRHNIIERNLIDQNLKHQRKLEDIINTAVKL